MIISRTPFRISFFGGGTDYPDWYEKNVGVTISATINKFSYISIRKLPAFFKFKHRIRYYKNEEAISLDKIKHPVVREAMKLMSIEEGLEIVHSADLPARSGIGSSSSFTVGLLHALSAYKNKMLTKRELAIKAINLEQNIIKECVGSQDQTIAAFGGFNFTEYNKLNTFEVHNIFTSNERKSSLEKNLILCFSGFARTAEEIAKYQILNIPKKEKELNKIIDITIQAKKILMNEKISLDNFGNLLNEQWYLKKKLSKNISNSNIDKIYNTAIKAGAIGGKLLGAGGGGFFVFYARKEDHKKIINSLKNYLIIPFRFDNNGSQIIYFSHD
jgi:D-glycero-alpha-D-manno-heptose-7-phosphate kinase